VPEVHKVFFEFKEFTALFTLPLSVAAAFILWRYGRQILERNWTRTSVAILIALHFFYFVLAFGLINGLSIGLLGGLGVGSLNHITLVETMFWKWNRFLKKSIPGLIVGLIFGLIFGLGAGLSVGLIFGLLGGLVSGLAGGFTVSDRYRPHLFFLFSQLV